MKKFWMVMFVALLLIFGSSSVQVTAESTTSSEADIPSETLYLEPVGYIILDSNNLAIINLEIQECIQIKTDAHAMAEAARALGYPEDHPVIKLAQAEYKEANMAHKYYLQRAEEIKQSLVDEKSQVWLEEYPTAAYIWLYLDEKGFNDYVKAGIIGNLMSECGGQTLALNWQVWSSKGYYGIVQWSKKYFPGVVGADLQGQCDFLMGNIETTFNTYGKNYKSGFNYEQFLNLQNEKEAALAFAKCYERCSSTSYEKRQANATKALKYFLDE